MINVLTFPKNINESYELNRWWVCETEEIQKRLFLEIKEIQKVFLLNRIEMKMGLWKQSWQWGQIVHGRRTIGDIFMYAADSISIKLFCDLMRPRA